MLATRKRSSSSVALLMLLPSFGALMTACAGQADISRVQPDAIDKSIFFETDGVTPRKFYYRQTIVGVPPTTAWAFEGLMSDMAKVRFEITDVALVGYRAYDYAPGSESPTTSGNNNTDSPVLIYKIMSHFDIKREYNPATGEQTNVISENVQDRPWNQRQYMRVDWSQNFADPANYDPVPMDPLLASTTSSGRYVSEDDDPLFNPDRPTFTRDYISFTHVQNRYPDLLACYTMFGGDDEVGPYGCGDAQITFRNALMPVPATEYEPLPYPDRHVITDTDGTPLRMAFTADAVIPCNPASLQAAGLTGDDCTTAGLDEFAKFGFFRTALPTYNRQVGSTQEDRLYYANRWNIWQETIAKQNDGKTPILDAQGNPVRIPLSQRKTRTITYYLNPEFPDDQALKDMAKTVVADWNTAMKETVMATRMATATHFPAMTDVKTMAQSLPDIFKLEDNGCTLANVNKFVTTNTDVRAQVEQRDTTHVIDFDNLQQADLLKACTALEVVTQSRADGDAKKFIWQHDGDLRYSFIHWVDRPQVQGPLGYGPSSADPETGEIVSAAAYLYGAALDVYAKFAVDSVQLANGNLSLDDLLSGQTISDVLARSAAATKMHANEKMTDAAKAAIKSRMQALGPTLDDRLRKVAAGIDDQPMNQIKGTTAEKLLLNDDVLPAVIPGYRPGDAVPNNVFDTAMAMPWLSSQAREQRRQRFQTLATHSCIYMAEFADDAILGTALELDKLKLTPDEMFKELRVRIFRGLTDHEVGHTMGLRHNFAASTDALNYDDEYWRVRTDPTIPQDKWESEHSLSELAYASVMDYGARFNSDIRGLGKYDTAAIRFGYGQMIDLIQQTYESAYTGLRNDIFLYDYMKLLDPYEAGTADGKPDNFTTAATTVAPYQALIDIWTTDFRQLATNMGKIHILPERPYKFCEDLFEGNLDCKTWDRGANQREIVDNITEQYQNYYAFNAYRRGRSNWGIDSYLNRLESRYFNRYSEAFQFFYFLSNYTDVDLGPDLFVASVDALNALGAILQTPEPGLHCPTATSPNVATFPVDPQTGNLNPDLCLANQPKLDIELPDAKPFYINFSDDYYYTFTRVGSLLEKLEALSALTSTESRFFRVDELSDVAARSSINYYRIFRDEVVKLLSGVIRNDPATYTATLAGASPNSAFQATPVVDLDTFGVLNPPAPPYAQSNAIHVLTPVNKSIRYWALLFGLGRLGSTWDYTLDFQNFVAVAVKGSEDDFTLAPNLVVEYTHPETGITYRAPTNTGGAAPNIGRQLLDELNAITGVAGTRGTVPLDVGSYTDGSAVPDWYSAKADLDAAAALPNTQDNQTAYSQALGTFNYVNSLVGYRIDLIADIRLFRKLLLLP
ncbi:MAG TPA: zinc-dependent metalloprotease [Polyangia bacterium]|nr:zinc-dependent metalloprotease [Polyangia bacterium]